MLLNNANAHLDGSIVTCDKRIDLFLSAFPMFVPSLSWSNDAFLVSKWHRKTGWINRHLKKRIENVSEEVAEGGQRFSAEDLSGAKNATRFSTFPMFVPSLSW
jgi:hypothetical protein